MYSTAPGKPQYLQTSNITSTSVSVSWIAPLEKNGMISHYIVLYEMRNKMEDKTVNVIGQGVALDDLHGYSLYSIEVQACNTIGICGQFSESVTITTSIGGK